MFIDIRGVLVCWEVCGRTVPRDGGVIVAYVQISVKTTFQRSIGRHSS